MRRHGNRQEKIDGINLRLMRSQSLPGPSRQLQRSGSISTPNGQSFCGRASPGRRLHRSMPATPCLCSSCAPCAFSRPSISFNLFNWSDMRCFSEIILCTTCSFSALKFCTLFSLSAKAAVAAARRGIPAAHSPNPHCDPLMSSHHRACAL